MLLTLLAKMTSAQHGLPPVPASNQYGESPASNKIAVASYDGVDQVRGYAPQAGRQPDGKASTARPLEGGQILARVEGEVILASDVLWQVKELIKQMEAERGAVPENQRDQVLQLLLRRQVNGLIETKLLYADFRRTVPPEHMPLVQEQLAEPFEEHEVPRLMKMLRAEKRADLEALFRKYGTSLKDVQRQFTERTISGQWLRERIPKPQPITHEQMLAYYHDHLKDYEFEAKAKYEELMVRYDRFHGDRDAAWRELSAMGNEVWRMAESNPGLRGPVFAEMAKARSHGFNAVDGGLHDWTTIGALRCDALNRELATLQIGQMSDGVASELGFHIVRVLERKDAGRTPFEEAQTDIRKLLENEQRQELVKAEVAKLRKDARVWTVFDGELRGARLDQALDGPQRR
ncbi:MAG: peptidyl-prolyl cis-trans isomerase [Planctomycetota bacterium]